MKRTITPAAGHLSGDKTKCRMRCVNGIESCNLRGVIESVTAYAVIKERLDAYIVRDAYKFAKSFLEAEDSLLGFRFFEIENVQPFIW